MNKDIKDYLHLYLGCKVLLPDGSKDILDYVEIDQDIFWYSKGTDHDDKPVSPCIEDIKLILRPLSDMTEEELQECGNMIYDFSDDPELNNHQWKDFEIGSAPEQFHWLLSKHFDLFGLIDAGLAIDKTTLNP